MQPESPYRYTHALGGSPVGKAWAAIDEQGHFVTVAVLDAPVAATPGWREAFSRTANALAQAPEPMPYTYADFAATEPWVAYPAHAGPGAERLFRALGVEFTPVPAGSPVSAPPVSGMPQQSVSGVPQQPVSGMPQPLPGTAQPFPGPAHPVSGTPEPVSGTPHPTWPMPAGQTSATPAARQPVSAAPLSPGAAPTSVPPSADFGMPSPSPSPTDPFTSTGRRIVPVQRQSKRPRWVWLVGTLALALAAGAGGFFVGRSGEAEADSVTAEPLAPFESTQASINRPRFDGGLVPLAEPWLPRIGGCVVYNDAGAPKLPADEQRHVYCPYGGVWLHFALYPGRRQRDAARDYREQLNLAGGALAPGMREATQTTGGVTGVTGNYVEYAFRGEDGRTVCGLWWDREDIDAAFYIETPCEEGIAGNWDALRDLWRRGS